MTTATNEKGETVVLVGDQWKPATQTAMGEGGKKAYLVDNQWVVDQPHPSERSFADQVKAAAPNVLKGTVYGGPLGGGLAATHEAGKMLENYAYKAGGKVTDALAGKVSPETAAGAGYAANVGMQAIPTVLAGPAVSGASKVIDALSMKLMQQAVKPSQFDLRTGAAERGMRTMLEEGISPTPGGMDKAHKIVNALEGQVNTAINTSPATVSKGATIGPVNKTWDKFSNQVNSADDLQAIENVVKQYRLDPLIPSQIPVKQAQDIKQGTYRVLRDKYGEMGAASDEAQKALAHGLRTEIGKAVPAVNAPLEREGQVMNAISVAMNRAGMSGNKDALGLSALGNNYAAAIAHLADRSTAIKAMLARALFSGKDVIPSTAARGATALAVQKQGYEE